MSGFSTAFASPNLRCALRFLLTWHQEMEGTASDSDEGEKRGWDYKCSQPKHVDVDNFAQKSSYRYDV